MLMNSDSYDVYPSEIPDDVVIIDAAGFETADMSMTEVPQKTEVIDGKEVVVTGDVDGTAALSHPQGDNSYGYLGTCGLCSCENILDSFGIQVSENDVVGFAIEHDLCQEGDPMSGDDPAMLGGTSSESQAELLTDMGIPAHPESGGSLEDLAANIENGHGVIVGVDAGVIWGDPNYAGNGQANHAIVVSGVARDPATGEIEGFFVNDTGTGEAGKFFDAATFSEAWVDTGSSCVVTDVVH